MATVLTEGLHAGEFMASDLEDAITEAVTVLSGQVLQVGHVVGRVRYGIGGIVSVLSGTSPGNGTMTAISAGPDVQVGAYLVQCKTVATNGGVFSVTAPDGTALPDATVGTAYVTSHLSFLLNDGSSDFQLTALFTVTVSTTAPVVSGGTGTGTISALSLGATAKPGTYTLTCIAAVTNGGVFQGVDPDGVSIGEFTMTPGSGGATAFTGPINFTLTDATDFIVGNAFAVVVFNQLVAKAVEWDPRPTTYDGRHRIAGILWDAVDATSADTPGVIVAQRADVKPQALTYKSTISAAEKLSAANELRRTRGINVLPSA